MPTLLSSASTPADLRAELVELFRRDILGPAGGPDEEVAEGRIQERYLVGMLAPRRQALDPGDFDEVAAAGGDSAEDGGAEPAALPAATVFPSSFGLTCSVDASVSEIAVTVRWGRYRKIDNPTPGAEPKRLWKRSPIEGSVSPLRLKPGPLPALVPVKQFPDVKVRGLVRQRKGYWTVSLFLVNDQKEPAENKGEAWLFQPELIVESPDGSPAFRCYQGHRDLSRLHLEDQSMEMLYRREVEFAVGHGVSVGWADPAETLPDRTTRVFTSVLPGNEVAATEAPTETEIAGLAGIVLDMSRLATLSGAQLKSALAPLGSAYASWIAGERTRLSAEPDLAPYELAGRKALDRCAEARTRIEAGIELLASDGRAAEAFRFMNEAMALQRVRTLYSEGVRRGEAVSLQTLDIPENHCWRPFQLAFILLNLPSLTELEHPDRSAESSATADLLWFPTGGGKTEAYLGLSAYTLAIRRLQGAVEGRPGDAGVAVLMRYTLRVLTLQQFQRAAALVCACEQLRREAAAKGDKRWGETPFRIGIWVGARTTPNTTDQSAEALKLLHGQAPSGGAAASPAQLTSCPWCGLAIDPGKGHIRVETRKQGLGRTFFFCGDPMGRCPFSEAKSPTEGIPVLVVDEEIYRLLPSMIIATVDKFAQMPWNGLTQMLFGQVDGFCERHGFRSPEVEDEKSHRATPRYPAATTHPHPPLRPVDLIIQDELHLISGPLGTLVGLYETAVDQLASWEVGGRRVRPKVVASTATVRRAATQVHSLFLRKVSVFPPHGLDAGDNFFSRRRAPSASTPGRLYLGLCAPGKRMTTAIIRVYGALMAAAQVLYERYGKDADPWMTLVGYFNSLRELGGTRRLVDDQVSERLKKMDQRGLAKRYIRYDTVEELTSRCSASEIPAVLDRMSLQFDPQVAAALKAAREKGIRQKTKKLLDVLLATNMISVGVDVKRLGLMAVLSQPKTTAEYIQATSRVGRGVPGLVCVLYNWARPRDLSHYETFQHYHATFYKHVEALSVTPFSARAVDRGLTAILAALIRLASPELNPNPAAGRVTADHRRVQAAIDAILTRAAEIGGQGVRARVEKELRQRLDEWMARAARITGGAVLGYRDRKDGFTVPLLQKAGMGQWDLFTCLNSLRDVEPTAGLILTEATPTAPELPAAGSGVKK